MHVNKEDREHGLQATATGVVVQMSTTVQLRRYGGLVGTGTLPTVQYPLPTAHCPLPRACGGEFDPQGLGVGGEPEASAGMRARMWPLLATTPRGSPPGLHAPAHCWPPSLSFAPHYWPPRLPLTVPPPRPPWRVGGLCCRRSASVPRSPAATNLR